MPIAYMNWQFKLQGASYIKAIIPKVKGKEFCTILRKHGHVYE